MGKPPRPIAGSGTGSHPHRGLPGAQRIKKRPDFLRIQDSPTRVNTRHLLVLLSSRRDISPGHDGGRPPSPIDPAGHPPAAPRPPRLGVVASRKVGNAVARNRAKRLVREAFRLNQERLPRELDLVIIVRPGTHELGLAEIAGEIVQAAPQIARRARELSRGG